MRIPDSSTRYTTPLRNFDILAVQMQTFGQISGRTCGEKDRGLDRVWGRNFSQPQQLYRGNPQTKLPRYLLHEKHVRHPHTCWSPVDRARCLSIDRANYPIDMLSLCCPDENRRSASLVLALCSGAPPSLVSRALHHPVNFPARRCSA